MTLTKEHQEAMVNKYLKTHTVLETEAFIDGMDQMIKLINKNLIKTKDYEYIIKS